MHVGSGTSPSGLFSPDWKASSLATPWFSQNYSFCFYHRFIQIMVTNYSFFLIQKSTHLKKRVECKVINKETWLARCINTLYSCCMCAQAQIAAK